MTEPSVPAEVLMSEQAADEITARFKILVGAAEEAVAKMQEVALEAHDGHVWKVKGYKSWDAYVTKEIGVSKRRANQLVAHARLRHELTAASGNPVPTLKERETRPLKGEERKELVADVAAAETPEQADSAIERALAKAKLDTPAPVKKPTATHRSNAYTVQFVDPELTDLVNLAVMQEVPVETMIVRLSLERLAQVKETGEVPATSATSRTRQRQPVAASSNGECPKHVASKPGLSGLVVCELCGLPRNKWPLATSTAGAGPKVERQSVEVESRLKK